MTRYIVLFLLGYLLSVYAQSGADFISYHVYGDPTSSKCDPTAYQSKYAGYITANTHNLPCETCVQMVSGSITIYAYAIDIGGRGFDLNLPAFCELCGDTGGFAAGGCNVNWTVVSTSTCDNWIAGKTNPNCNLCPSGSVCNNPDPNRNGGVNWDSYCATVDPGTQMRFCEMRVDGCTCYNPSGTPTLPPSAPPTKPPSGPPTKPPSAPPTKAPSAPPTKPPSAPPTKPPSAPPTKPPSAPPTKPPSVPPTKTPTKSPIPKATTTTRCGVDWGTANTQCLNDCITDNECLSLPGTHCYADLSMSPCSVSGIDAGDTASHSDNIGLYLGIGIGVGVLVLVGVVAGGVYYKCKLNKEERV